MSAKTEQMKRIFNATAQVRVSTLMERGETTKAKQLAKKTTDKDGTIDVNMSVADAIKARNSVFMSSAERKSAGLPSKTEKFKKKVSRVLHQGKDAIKEAMSLIDKGEDKTFLKKNAKDSGFSAPVKRGNPNIGKIRAAQLKAQTESSDDTEPKKKRGNPNIGKIRAAQLAAKKTASLDSSFTDMMGSKSDKEAMEWAKKMLKKHKI